MSVQPWFSQPDEPIGTAVVLPGRVGGISLPVLHWPATLLTQRGWSVRWAAWSEDQLLGHPDEHVLSMAREALAYADPALPVLIVAKSLGTRALPWAVRHGLPGAWLTPLTDQTDVAAAASAATRPTLLVGGTADASWVRPPGLGADTTVVEVEGADHGLQIAGDWRGSLTGQIAVYDAVEAWVKQVEGGSV